MTTLDDAFVSNLLDTQVPSCLSLSADGTALVYATGYDRSGLARNEEHRVSTIWHAQTGEADSSRQLTSGLHNDTLPAIAPDGKSVIFTSDRAKKGESCAIYHMSLSGGEPIPLTPKDNEQAIELLKWSPDSKHVAYLCADEKSTERKEKDKRKDDVAIFGKDLSFNRLRVINIVSKVVRTISNIDQHITEFDWSSDGESLAFITTERPDRESVYCLPSKIYTVGKDGSQQTLRATFPTYTHDLTFTTTKLFFVGSVSQISVVGSFALYEQDLETDGALPTRIANGDTDCCTTVKKVHQHIASQIQSGLFDEIRVGGSRTLVRLPNQILAWDIAGSTDSGDFVTVMAKGDINSPPEVYSQASSGPLIKLSNHAVSTDDTVCASSTFISCRTIDQQETVEAVLHVPGLLSIEPATARPAIVWIHGGPYHRLTDCYNPGSFYFVQVALKLGFTVLLPNYRGGSGRGESFASKARGGMGIYDEPDIVALTQHCVEQGHIDKERIIVAGWSQGGHLSYLSAVRNGMHGLGWKYKAAIPGAGVTDWDTMSFTSDVGRLQAVFGGIPAWTAMKDDTRNRTGSAIWEFKKAAEAHAIPPMLILHGEKDDRVPIEQAHAFRRGLDHYKLPYEMAVYPREGHTIKERYHVEDMLHRFAAFIQKHV